jgi:hypothetical protein
MAHPSRSDSRCEDEHGEAGHLETLTKQIYERSSDNMRLVEHRLLRGDVWNDDQTLQREGSPACDSCVQRFVD